jgi:SAM-dependent methyltransferase
MPAVATSIPPSGVEPHNRQAARVWSGPGAAYEAVSRSIADSIAHAVRALDPQPGERVLDIATGTGWTAREVAWRGAQVTGVDIAHDLVAAARARADAEALRIDFEVADAEALPFADHAFDAAISTCGIMFAARPEAAAAELARVVRPGGRIALTTWRPDGNVFAMFRIMRTYMAPPPQPAPPSPFEWGREERVQTLLGGAFDLSFEPAVSYYRELGAQAAWETFSAAYGPLHALAGALDDARRASLARDFIEFHEGFVVDDGICVPRDYLLTLGVRR